MMEVAREMIRKPDEIRMFLRAKIADLLGKREDEVDETATFADLGLDSVAAVGLVTDLGDWLGTSLPETLVWDFPTVRDVAEHCGRMS